MRRVEDGVGRDPRALRLRVALLALVGYAGLLAALLLFALISLAFFAAMYWTDTQGRIVCGLAGLAVLLGGGSLALNALLVRVPYPEGREVTRAEAPELFNTLDELRQRLGSAPFHKVLINSEFNAGVAQLPRLGALGWTRNYLILGLPLLEALSSDEMRAVLAHEFTHLSRRHGRFSHWLYRLRRSWEEVFKQMARPTAQGEISLRPLTVWFMNWLWPRFNAHAFVLSRTNEYEADAQAARLAGTANMGASLIRLRLHARQLEDKFWPDLWLLANEQAEPPGDVFERIRASLRAGLDERERRLWLQEALREASTNLDTHPCLAERLRALGATPADISSALPELSPLSAAEVFLGPAMEEIRRDTQKLWRKAVVDHWRKRHERAESISHRLVSLEKAAPNAENDPDTLWEKAMALLNLRKEETVTPLLRRIIELRSDHLGANFHLGRILLEAGDDSGMAHLERVMAEDDESVPQAASLLHDHYRRMGLKDKICELDARMDDYEKNLDASRAERREVTVKDSFIPHELTPTELDALRAVLAAEPDLVKAELGRKELKFFPKQKLFLLCVRCRPIWHFFRDRERERALASRLSASARLPGRVLVFAPSGGFRALAKKLSRVPGAEVFRRE